MIELPNFSPVVAAISLGFLLSTAQAADIVNDRSIGMELARDIATASIEACREKGFHVSAVVVDRFGLQRAALRDDMA